MRTCDLQPFVSQVVPQNPVTSNSLEIMKQEIERYLQRMRDALCADLQDFDARLTDLEQRVTACCGSS